MPVSLSERTVRTLAQITAVLIEASAGDRPKKKKTASSLARVPSVKRHTAQDTGSRIKSAAIGRRCYK